MNLPERESEHLQELGRHLLQHGETLVFAAAGDGRTRFVNQAVSRLLGYSPEELLDRPLLDIVLPRHESERVQRLLFGEAPVLPSASPVEFRRRDGTLVTLLLSAEVRRDANRGNEILLYAREPGRTGGGPAADALFDALPMPALTHEPDSGRILAVNQALCRLTGFSREELVVRGLRDIVPALPRERWTTVVNREGPEVELKTRDGRFVPVSLTSTRAPDGDVQAILTCLRELPRRREKDDNEARFRRAFDSLMDGFCLLQAVRNPEGEISDFRVTYANPVARPILGLNEAELVGDTLLDLLPASSVEVLMDLFRSVVETGHNASYQQLRLRTARGKGVFALHASRHADGVAWTFRDETDRARAAQMLALSEKRLSVLLSQLPVGVYFVNVDDPDERHELDDTTLRQVFARQVITNRRTLEILGDRTDLMGTNRYRAPRLFWRGGAELKSEEFPLRVVLETSRPFHSDQIELRPHGREAVLLEIRAEPIRNQVGRVVALVAVISDITQRVSMEAELARDQRMRALGTLAGGIAHDFNNIVQAISGSLELALHNLPREHSARANIQAAQRAASRVSSLTAQLLSASRQRIDAVETQPIGPLLQETATLLRGSFEPRATVELNLAPDLWPAVVEPGLLQQCVVNLALNARDAMEGKGAIRVQAANASLVAPDPSMGPDSRAGEFVTISVTDHGAGIPPEVLAHLFEPFLTTKPIGKGHGLGLSAVYNNMKRLGGWVRVQTGPEGSTFTLFLQRGRGEAAALASPAATEPQPEALRRGSEHVLIVDDEADIVDIAREILLEVGYRVSTAGNGEAGVEFLRANRDVDLVLLDLTMPGLSGTDVLRLIRAENLSPTVVVTSGFASGVETGDLVAIGADAFLPKPFSLSQLTTTLREQLDLRRHA